MTNKSFASDTRIGLSLWFWGSIVFQLILAFVFGLISMSIFVPGGISTIMAMSDQEVALIESSSFMLSVLLPTIVIFFSSMLASFYVNRKYYIHSRKFVILTALGIHLVYGFLLMAIAPYLQMEDQLFTVFDVFRQVIFFAVFYFTCMFFLEEGK